MTKNQNGCGQGVRQMISNKIVCVSAFKLIALLATLWAQAVAAMTEAEMQAELNADGSFIRATGTTYQFQGAPHVGVPLQQPSQTIESLHARLLAGKPSSLASTQTTTWIPIAGDITIFIPRHQTVYPLQKRIGDAFVQSRLIRTQVQYKLGRHLISGVYQTEAQQINQLYDNAYALANTAGFLKKFGDSLTPSDLNVAALDVIWPELRTINGESVLVPVLHLTAATLGDHSVTGHTVEFQGGDALFKNIEIVSGSITTRRNTVLAAAQNFVVGEGASVTSTGDLNLAVGGTLLSYGTITAGQTINITAGNYHQKTLVHRFKTRHGTGERLGLISSVNVGDSIVVESHGDIIIQGAELQAGADIIFDAQGNIRVGTVTLSSSEEAIARNSRHQYSAVEHVQSTLSAGDNIKMMSAGMIEIDAANLHANRGHIQLLAELGISVLDAANQTQTVNHKKWRNGSFDESSYISIAVRAVLDAGKGVAIHTNEEDVILRAVKIDAEEGTSINSDNGKIRLLMAKEIDHYQRHSMTESKWRIKNTDLGHEFEHAVYPEIIGGLKVNALYGVEVELARTQDMQDPASYQQGMDWYIEKTANTPGLSWMRDIKEDVDWTQVELQTRAWRKTKKNLSPAAMAVVSIAVAVATGGASLAATSTLSAVTTAAVNTVATQLVVSLAAGNSLDTALKSLDDDEFLESLAISMVTAGALSELSTSNAAFFPTGEGLSLAKQSQSVLIESAVQSTVSWAVKGGDFESLRDGFTTAVAQNAIQALGEHAAGEIVQAADTYNFDRAVEYIAHAASGCVIGLAKAEVGGSSSQSSCYSAAGGAVIGEFVGTLYEEAQVRRAKEYTAEWLEKYGVVGGPDLSGLSPAEIDAFIESSPVITLEAINSLKRNGVDLARMSAALTAFIAGGDVELAASSAETVARYAALADLNQQLTTVSAIDEYISLQSTVQLVDELLAAVRSGSPHLINSILLTYANQHEDLAYILHLTPAQSLQVLAAILSSSLHGRSLGYEMKAFLSSDTARTFLTLDEGTFAEGLKDTRDRTIDQSALPPDTKVAIKIELDQLYAAFNDKPPIEEIYEVVRAHVGAEHQDTVDAGFGIVMGLGQVVVNTGADVASTGQALVLAPNAAYEFLMYRLTSDAHYKNGYAQVMSVYYTLEEIATDPVGRVTDSVRQQIESLELQHGNDKFLFYKNVTVAVVNSAVALKAVASLSRELLNEFNDVNAIDVADIPGYGFKNIPASKYAAIWLLSFKNPSSDTLILGKYYATVVDGKTVPAPNSYNSIAHKEGAAYFDMGEEWDSVKDTYNLSPDDMFEAFNIPVLDEAVFKGKVIKFSHPPSAGISLQKEWTYLQEVHGYTELVPENGFWYAK